MENNNGKGIFYGVIGVATLIVAIIGATFAYFSATTVSKEYVQGAAATASLGVHVDRLTTYSAGEGVDSAENAKFVMVPQLDAGISAAIRGSSVTSNVPCIDANGSLVCSIYKITVQNTGSAAIDVSGFIDFYGTTNKTADGSENVAQDLEKEGVETGNNLMNHLKWARLEDPAGLYTTAVKGEDGESVLHAAGTFAAIDAVKAIPSKMLDYTANGGVYQTEADSTTHTYQNHTNPNVYFYGMNVTVAEVSADFTSTERNTWVDILGGTKYENGSVTGSTQVWSHAAYRDLIDPTMDLKLEGTSYVKDDADEHGTYHLEAYNQIGDTKVFYIVVWISENLQEQNDVDFGQFTGQITFESAGGSGATSTFTEAYAGA